MKSLYLFRALPRRFLRGSGTLQPRSAHAVQFNIHVEAGGKGAVGVDGGLYGIHGREVGGRALLDAVSAGKIT